MRLTRVALCLTMVPQTLAAQAVRLSVSASGGDYREQSSALSFEGSGLAGQLELKAGRFRLTSRGSQLDFRRGDQAPSDLEPFKQRELEVSAAVRLLSIVSVEGGSLRRWVNPARAAQSVSASRLGLRGDYPVAPGTDATLRIAALGATRFSGGGATKLGVAVGFGLSYGAKRRGIRAVVDYDFVRLDRETRLSSGVASVPIQSSIARLGIAVVF